MIWYGIPRLFCLFCDCTSKFTEISHLSSVLYFLFIYCCYLQRNFFCCRHLLGLKIIYSCSLQDWQHPIYPHSVFMFTTVQLTEQYIHLLLYLILVRIYEPRINICMLDLYISHIISWSTNFIDNITTTNSFRSSVIWSFICTLQSCLASAISKFWRCKGAEISKLEVQERTWIIAVIHINDQITDERKLLVVVILSIKLVDQEIIWEIYKSSIQILILGS